MAGASIRDNGGLRCTGCGYDLRGLPRHSRCPECGRTIAEALPITRRPLAERREFARAIWAMLLAGTLVTLTPLVGWWLVWCFDVRSQIPDGLAPGESRRIHPWRPWDVTVFILVMNLAFGWLLWSARHALRLGERLHVSVPWGLYESIGLVGLIGFIDSLIWISNWPQAYGSAAENQFLVERLLLCVLAVLAERFGAYTVHICRRAGWRVACSALRMAHFLTVGLFAFLLLDRFAYFEEHQWKQLQTPAYVVPVERPAGFILFDSRGFATRTSTMPEGNFPKPDDFFGWKNLNCWFRGLSSIDSLIVTYPAKLPVAAGMLGLVLVVIAAATWCSLAVTLGRRSMGSAGVIVNESVGCLQTAQGSG